MRIKVLYIFMMLVLPMLSLAEKDMHALFIKGNGYYAKGQYKKALSTYQDIIDQGYQSAGVYFNMGNASYKTDDVPSALLYYEKAHRLSPSDDDINFNIALTNLKITDKIEVVPSFFLNRWWQAFILSFSLSALSSMSIAFVLLGSFTLIVYFFAGGYSAKKVSFYAAIGLFLLGLLTMFVAGGQNNYFNAHKQAIIFSSSVNVKSGPADKLNTLFVIHEGIKVNTLESNQGWQKIKLPNGNEGWVKQSDFKEI